MNTRKVSTLVLGIVIFFLSFLFTGESVAEKRVRILHINDFHGYAVPFKPYGLQEMRGGIANLAARVDVLRKGSPTILLSAGDMIQGNNWANFSKGKSTIEVMNAMKFDAMVVGNHEFDFGQEVLRERIGEAQFPFLCANVEGFDLLKPYTIKDVDGVKVAIIGLVTGDTPHSTHPRNVAGITFQSPFTTAEKYVRELRPLVDLVVVLSHIGYSVDRELAEKVRGIDIIVGGHSHTKVTKAELVGRTFVVQAWEHGLALGVVDATVRNGKMHMISGRIEEIKTDVAAKNDVVAEIVERYAVEVNATLNQVIGEAEVDFNGRDVRKTETNLGNFIADIFRTTASSDVAIINGGGLRTSIRQGPVKVNDIYSVLPFDNYIVAIRMTGRQIRDALEHGVSGVEAGEGRFPQVSGLSFSYTVSAPKGDRVKDVMIGGQPLDPEKSYSVATNDFLAAGGDGYASFGTAVKSSKDYAVVGGVMTGSNLVYNDSGRWLRDVVVEYIRAQNKITAAVEGRITEAK